MTVVTDNEVVPHSSSSIIMAMIRAIMTNSTTITPTTAPVALLLPLLPSACGWTPVMILSC